ncbi:hypothetical protein GCM10022244_14420 [Streptomyces gulbargensis]|uniref:Uncharacterized protein n=1 Tax=Streptomyces gulbargensis TaxID=364901 RepID=A0ABP7LSU8_9ACTN
MRTRAERKAPDRAPSGRPRLTDEEFRRLLEEARAEVRRRSFAAPPPAEPAPVPGTGHVEPGAAAH